MTSPPAVHAGAAVLVPPAVPSSAAGRLVVARAFVRAVRPRQWTKNLLAFAAPAAAGSLSEGSAWVQAGAAFIALTLASASTYLVNDLRDLEADRRHPTKCRRPLAAGTLPVVVAVVAAPVLALAAVVLGLVVSPWLAAIVLGYLALTFAYTTWLKHEAVLDIAAIAGGFMLRVFAGAAAVDVPVSRWLVIVASFCSLFVVVGKRRGELGELGEEGQHVRATLLAYSDGYLAATAAVCSGVSIVAYCLWAFEAPSGQSGLVVASIVPFVVAMLRYGLVVDQGLAAEPEEVFLRDRPLQLAGLCWALLFGAGVYLA
jgi:decaprenyl-phosphate phosphoribosyltransferase